MCKVCVSVRCACVRFCVCVSVRCVCEVCEVVCVCEVRVCEVCEVLCVCPLFGDHRKYQVFALSCQHHRVPTLTVGQ